MNTQKLIFAILILFLYGRCSEKDEGSQTPGDVQDISSSSEITPYGGELEVSDASGNVITLTFPPGAIRDTTTVTLTILGDQKDLPINERQIRSFTIQPADLSLYRPVTISVEYPSAVSAIEESALFRLHSNEWLTPLGEHTYPAGSRTITANTLFLGEFAEGKMTIEQINVQLDLLATHMGISLKSSNHSYTANNKQASGCEEYKAAWDDWLDTSVAFMKFFTLRELLGYYNEPGRGSFDEDIKKVCENIVDQGINDVLDLGEPADPCCPDYAHAIESMMQAAIGCGVQGSTLDKMNNSYDKVHSECHTYMDITNEVNVGDGGLLILTTGEVMITLTGTGDGEAIVSGTGELVVTGSGDAGGDCTATISGQTFVQISGNRDAAYVYTLTVEMNQIAMMTTVCPDRVVETPLIGGSPRNITLSTGNNFSLSETETIDEGFVTYQATLHNPYAPAPEP